MATMLLHFPPTTLVVFVFVSLLQADSAGGFPYGAPPAACTTGLIPESHGGKVRQGHPYSVRLLNEYTDVVANGYRPGQNYDVEIQTPSAGENGIAGFLIRDMTQSESWTAALASSRSANDHREGDHAFFAPAATVRCSGDAVTHSPLLPGNISATSKDVVRRTLRAPASGPWTLRFSLLAVPPKAAGFHLKYPVESDGSFSTGVLGESYLFTKTFQPHQRPPEPTCDSVAKQVCATLSTGEVSCRNHMLPSCATPWTDAVVTVDSKSKGYVVGARNHLLRLSPDFTTVTRSATTDLDYTRLVAPIRAGDHDAVLVCGTGEGRPGCQLWNASLDGAPESAWEATGAIPRQRDIAYSNVLVGGSLYSGHHQVRVPHAENGANVIGRSEIDDTSKWSYHYREFPNSVGKLNNQLHRSTSVAVTDNDWLYQPTSSNSYQTHFGGSWEQGGSVYFGLSEKDSANRRYNAISRVCHDEGTTPVDGAPNLFRSYVKLRIFCTGVGDASRTYPLDQLTAVATPAPNSTSSTTLFVAFKTSDEAEGDEGVGICAYSYGGKGGIDHEMNGVIDADKNNPGLAFVGRDGSPFSCTRSDFYYDLVLVGKPPDASFAGKGDSKSVVFTQARGSTITRLVHDTVVSNGHPDADVLWAIDTAGVLSKIHVSSDRSLASRAVEVFTLDPNPTSLTLDVSQDSVVVGGPNGVVRVPRSRCHEYATCDSCTVAADPYCGWCSASSSCTSVASCHPTKWKPGIGGNADACPVAPEPVTSTAEALSSSSVSVSWSAATPARSGTFTDVEYSVGINGKPGHADTVTNGTSITLRNLAPFTSYALVVIAFNAGGTSFSTETVVVTLEAAPAKPIAPEVQETTAFNVSLTWAAPVPANGVITRYSLARDGEEVCCGGTQTSFVDTDLTPFTRYSYTIGAETVAGAGEASDATTAKTDESTPGAPDAPIASSITPTTATLTWKAPPAVNGVLTQFVLYVGDLRVWRSTEDGFTPLGTTAALAGLRPHTAYSYSVRAYTAAGPGPRSAAVRFTTAQVAPARPNPPRVSTASQVQSLTVTWEAPVVELSPPVAYELFMSSKLDQLGSLVGRFDGTSATIEENLDPCSVYRFSVKALSSEGAGEPSYPTIFQTHSGTINAPPKLSLFGSPSTDFAVLSWPELACDVSRVIVERRESRSGTATEICCSASESFGRKTTATNLKPATKYWFTLRAEHQRGDSKIVSAQSQVLAITTASGTARPGKLSAPSVGDIQATSVVVSWAVPASSVIRYEVARGNVVVCCDGSKATTFVDVGLEAETQYRYRVRAFNTVGAGDFSDDTAVTTGKAAAEDTSPSSVVTFSLDREFSASLGDSSSGEFTALANEIEVAVSETLKGVDGTHEFSVVSFASGSVVVTGQLESDSQATQAQALAALKDAIAVENGLGSLAVNADSFTSKATSGSGDTCVPSNGVSSSVTVIAVGACLGIIVVILMLVVFVQWKRLHTHNSVSGMQSNPSSLQVRDSSGFQHGLATTPSEKATLRRDPQEPRPASVYEKRMSTDSLFDSAELVEMNLARKTSEHVANTNLDEIDFSVRRSAK